MRTPRPNRLIEINNIIYKNLKEYEILKERSDKNAMVLKRLILSRLTDYQKKIKELGAEYNIIKVEGDCHVKQKEGIYLIKHFTIYYSNLTPYDAMGLSKLELLNVKNIKITVINNKQPYYE